MKVKSGEGISGNIFKIKRFSVHDGPGIRTVVFLKGCPLRCTWCHSPEGQESNFRLWHDKNACIACGLCVKSCGSGALSLDAETHDVHIDRRSCRLTGDCVKACPSTALQFTGKKMSIEEVFEEIEKDMTFYKSSGGGVTFSGGEPFYQDTFVMEISRMCREHKIHTAAETCLKGEFGRLEKLAFIDLLIIDLKIFDLRQHKLYTGQTNADILENFRKVATSGIDIMVRIPLVKNITDVPENIKAITGFVHSIDKNIPVEYIKYNPLAGNNYKRLGIPFGL